MHHAMRCAQGMPRNGQPATVAAYATLLFVGGLMKSWSAPALNNPVMAEIVPPHCRSLIFAFDRCFEGETAGQFAVTWSD